MASSEAESKAMELEGDSLRDSDQPLPHLIGKPYKKQADSIFSALFDKARQLKQNADGTIDAKVSYTSRFTTG